MAFSCQINSCGIFEGFFLTGSRKVFTHLPSVSCALARLLQTRYLFSGGTDENNSAALAARNTRWRFGQAFMQGIQRKRGRAAWLSGSALLDVTHS